MKRKKIDKNMNYYKIYGNPTVDLVIEMGLGACISEWDALATELGKSHGVLVYERAGINHSKKSDQERTPKNIAMELKMLLDTVSHEEKIVVLGHSQGGLYASEFCGLYPEMIKRLVLLDPLSKTDVRFRKELTAKELKKSGADKSKNFDLLRIMAALGLKSLIKKTMCQAPPFYYAQFTGEQRIDILNSLVNIAHLDTCREEYRLAHDESILKKMVSKEDYPDIPMVLITHSSEAAIRENMEFGGNTRSFAVRVEGLWQDIMKDYMDYSKNATWMQAKRSTHYIHLVEPEIILSACR